MHVANLILLGTKQLYADPIIGVMFYCLQCMRLEVHVRNSRWSLCIHPDQPASCKQL